MKHVTYSEKSLLIGDEAADLLMQYATMLGRADGVDSVTVHAIGVDGNDTSATFLLNSASILMVESANTNASEPDNTDTVRYLKDRIDELTGPHNIEPTSGQADEALEPPGDY